MLADMRVRPATPVDLPEIARFLQANKLPTNGIEKWVNNFIVASDGKGSWIGVAGLEIYGNGGLMRSLAVNEHFRGLGYGRALVEAVLRNARKEKIQTIYLLTDGAEGYFKRLGFEAVDRANVDEAVRTSSEFTECCETAVAMRRPIT